MSDDFKISLDIEGNLTRLDSTLLMAESKVNASAMRMQHTIGNALSGGTPIATASASPQFAQGTYASFGGGLNAQALLSTNPLMSGLHGITPLAGLGSSGLAGGNFSGRGVAFGNGLNVRAGNGGVRQYVVPMALRQMIAERTRMDDYNTNSWGMRVGGLAAIAYGGADAVNALADTSNDYERSLAARNRGDDVAQQQGYARIQNRLYGTPFIGTAIAGFRKWNHATDAEAQAGAMTQSRALRFENQRGFMGGGYSGIAKDLVNDFQSTVPEEQERLKTLGVRQDVRASLLVQSIAKLGRQLSENTFNRGQEIADLQSSATQSRLGSMGLGNYAGILETRRSFRRGIELADRQGDTGLSRQLTDTMNAQLSEQFMGNISPSQELNAPQALGPGSVRLGSTSGQSDAYLAFLSKIAQNTQSGPPLGRN